jgi:uncharacterized protein (TIRG00374 family)
VEEAPAFARPLRRGAAVFAVLSVAAVVGVFLWTATPASLAEALHGVSPSWLAACLVVPPLADWTIAGARLRLFTAVLSPAVSYAACVRCCAVGAFVAAATPSQTGGGPAQAYVLVKEGATLAQSLAALFLTFLSTLLFYFALALALWGAVERGAIPGADAGLPFLAAALLFGVLAAAGVWTLFRPARARRAVGRLTAWLRRRHLPARLGDRLGEALDGCGDGIAEIGSRHRLRFAASLAISAGVFGNRFVAAWFAARALGLDPPLAELVLVQAFLHVLLYFFPTPGASGGAEVSAAALMAPLVPAALLAPFTLLWRTATAYLSVIVGGIFLARAVRGRRQR